MREVLCTCVCRRHFSSNDDRVKSTLGQTLIVYNKFCSLGVLIRLKWPKYDFGRVPGPNFIVWRIFVAISFFYLDAPYPRQINKTLRYAPSGCRSCSSCLGESTIYLFYYHLVYKLTPFFEEIYIPDVDSHETFCV